MVSRRFPDGPRSSNVIHRHPAQLAGRRWSTRDTARVRQRGVPPDNTIVLQVQDSTQANCVSTPRFRGLSLASFPSVQPVLGCPVKPSRAGKGTRQYVNPMEVRYGHTRHNNRDARAVRGVGDRLGRCVDRSVGPSDLSAMIAFRTILSAGVSAHPRRCTSPSVRNNGGSSGRTTTLFVGGARTHRGSRNDRHAKPGGNRTFDCLNAVELHRRPHGGITGMQPSAAQLPVRHPLVFQYQCTARHVGWRRERQLADALDKLEAAAVFELADLLPSGVSALSEHSLRNDGTPLDR